MVYEDTHLPFVREILCTCNNRTWREKVLSNAGGEIKQAEVTAPDLAMVRFL